MHQSVLTVAQPFGLKQQKKIGMPAGMSIRAIAEHLFGGVQGVVAFVRCPEGSRQQWEIVEKDRWHLVKPIGLDVLKFEFFPAGGDTTNLFLIAAAVVVTIAAPYLLPVLGPAFAVGTLANAALSTAIAIGANLAVAALYQPPDVSSATTAAEEAAEDAFTNVTSDSNLLGKGVAPPKVLGQRRVTLPDACRPFQYLEGGVDVIERVMVAGGISTISEIEVEDVSTDSYSSEEVQIQITDGSDGSGQQTLVQRCAFTTAAGQQFTEFQTESDSDFLTDQGTPENAEPQAIIIAPGYHDDIDQLSARITLDPFLFQASDTEDVRLPIRVSFRSKSDPATIYYVPEIHIKGRSTVQKPKEIRIRWDGNFGKAATPDFDYTFYRQVPAAASTLSDGSTGLQWEANAAFSSGSGNTETKAIAGTLDSINITLNENNIPRDDYEISIVVGLPIRDSLFTETTYELNGAVESLFRSKDNGNGTWVIPASRDGVFASATINFHSLVIDRHPVERPGMAQLAMIFRGINAANVTALVATHANDYNSGTGQWDTFGITLNPASHYRQVLEQALVFSRVDTTLIDDDEMSAWYAECESRGFECNFVASGQTVNEILGQVAAAGFATKRFGNGYGIGYHRDRSAEIPEVTFSNRDSVISVARFYVDNPKGYRVGFDNEADDWQEDEVFINNQWGRTTLEENVLRTYPAITKKSLIERRATFDMLQEHHQAKVWRIETGPAGFNRKRADLIGLVTDLDTDFAHGFYVRQVLDSRTIAVDRVVPVKDVEPLSSLTDLLNQTDLLTAGGSSQCNILMPTGLETYTIEEVAGNIIRLTTDLSDEAIRGTRVTVYAYEKLFRRMVVLDVERQSDEKAVVFAVDEAPEIEDTIVRLFG